ncbi:porin [Alphaproteobacteria bacterium]|nr:porin [Alphaproteobacteria bacterium]
MRKLLLGTTALAAAATLSANAALADVSISGYYEWRYESRSSQLAANDGTTFGNDSEITFKFTNKTDSGLTVEMYQELTSDAPDGDIDEANLSISGGFGKVILGQQDGVNDQGFGIAANNLVSEEMYTNSATEDMQIVNGDMANLGGDDNKITYITPSMGGLTAGISYTDSGAVGSSDTTEVAAKYAMEAGGAKITLGVVSGTTENSTQDIDSSVVGVQIDSGDISVIVSQSEYEASSQDEQGVDFGVSYKVSDALKVVAYTTEVEDDSSSEEYSNTGFEAVYTIASGLAAIVTIEDYDYKVGTLGSGSAVADSGTHSKLTIKATF